MGRSTLVVITIATGGVIGLIYWYRKRRFDQVSEFVEIGTVSQLNLYPVKSMRGIQVDQIECGPLGGICGEVRDRHFMVVDAETGKFITARQIPKLVTVRVNVENDVLTLKSGDRTFYLSISDVVNENITRRAELFDGLKQDGLDCGDEVADFLKSVLGTKKDLRLIHHVDGLYSERDIIPKKQWMLGKVPERVDRMAFADDGPYMALCDNSLSDLNDHFTNGDFEMRRFRPVIQIAKAPAYDEDMWAQLKIADVVFDCFKPCTRCVITTIDPKTGIMDHGVQPLKTLRKYRLAPGRLRAEYGQSPVFGVLMGIVNGGVIRTGDKVYAAYKTHPH